MGPIIIGSTLRLCVLPTELKRGKSEGAEKKACHVSGGPMKSQPHESSTLRHLLLLLHRLLLILSPVSSSLKKKIFSNLSIFIFLLFFDSDPNRSLQLLPLSKGRKCTMSVNPLCLESLDVKTSSDNCPQLKKKMGSSVLEQVVKVRKPYTITKQRERWTEEEHNKFLEALKLYGRAWRQIEEHVGTKTAVQIRSHAQKFFTKVVREAGGDNSGEVKSIEVPPPRPKRKPMHPYPRKLGKSPRIPVMEKPEWSLIPKLAVSAQENLSIPKLFLRDDNPSPMSVLSAVGSDAFGSGSPVSDLINSCTSPVSSAVGSDPAGTLFSDQENGCQSATTSVDDEENSLLLNISDMELDLGTDASVPCKEALTVEAPAASLKLFGKTLMVADPHKSSCPAVADSEQCHQSPSPTTNLENHRGNLDVTQQIPAQVHEQDATDEGRSQWNNWPSAATPMFYILPTHGNVPSSAEASVAAMPLMWTFCGGASPFMVTPQSLNSEHDPLPSSSDNVDWNTSSSVEAGIGDRNTSTDGAHNLSLNLKLMPSATSAFRSLKPISNKPSKGFVPYKRCVPEKKVDNQKMGSDNAESRGMQLCL